MKLAVQTWCALPCLFVAFLCSVGTAQEGNPRLIFKTNAGEMTIELYPKEAPVTVKNFLQYAKSGFFEGTIFHRTIPGFVIQGGGFTADAERKKTEDPIKNEADNGLKNLKYTLSMARTNDPASATSQFFVNLEDNAPLDRDFPRGDGFGYAVFGKVVDGQDVVDKIAQGKTQTLRKSGLPPMKDWPVEPIIVEKVEIIKTDAKPAE